MCMCLVGVCVFGGRVQQYVCCRGVSNKRLAVPDQNVLTVTTALSDADESFLHIGYLAITQLVA